MNNKKTFKLKHATIHKFKKNNLQNIKLLPENEIDAHLIDKRIINSKQPNRKEVQAFYQEDFIQGSLF